MENNYFNLFNAIDFADKLEKKNDLLYLPWAVAWGTIKKEYPMSYYTIYESTDGWNYFTDGRTCWVKTGVTVVFDEDHSLEHIEDLPIMDYKNKSIPLESITSKDVINSIQRSLTKAAARHGVGLYVYAKESSSEELAEARKKVIAEARKVIKSGVAKDVVSKVIASMNNDNANPNSIEKAETAVAIYEALVALATKEETK